MEITSAENACLTDIINGADVLRELAESYDSSDRTETVYGLREKLGELTNSVNRLYHELCRKEGC